MSSLDVTSRAYDAAVFARFALELSRALTVLDGPLLLLLPGLKTVSETRNLLDVEGAWPEADADRLIVSSIGARGAPTAGEDMPAAVVMLGLT